ncbi:hypothetical protein ACFL12_01135 [Pseudomonadota bacterium]
MEIRFTVWQFVRLMVHAEEGSDPAGLLGAWGDIWTPLDADLGHLAEEDFDGFSDLMMNQDVVIENVTEAQALAAADALTAVMKALDGAIEEGGEDEQIQHLKFERRELRQLARKITRQVTTTQATAAQESANDS